MLLAAIPTLDAILEAHATDLGGDFVPYRNHAFRVASLCAAHAARSDPETIEKIAIAAAFHDLGIWTDRTFDYLAPSIALADRHLAETGRAAWTAEIAAMIGEHHKITSYRANPGWLVEPFRRADWTDVSLGLVRFGQPRSFVRALYAEWPGAGFHWRLVQLEAGHLRKHPTNPLPVLKL